MQAALLEPPLRMREPRAESQAVKAATLHLVPLPQHMEVAAEVQVLALQLQALAALAEVRGQKDLAQAPQPQTVQVAAGTVQPVPVLLP